MNNRKDKPSWYRFRVNCFKDKSKWKDEETPELKEEFKEFWNKINSLRREKIKCKCGNDENEPMGFCSKCWLKIENPKWNWVFGNRDNFLCISSELQEKMHKATVDKSLKFNYGLSMTMSRGNIWETMRDYFFALQKEICPECKRKFKINEMELHHKIPVCEGGRESSDNLVLLCDSCHHTHIIEIY